MPAAGKICGRTAGGALDLSAGLCFIIHRVQFRGRRGDGGMVDNGTAGAGADCAGQQERNGISQPVNDSMNLCGFSASACSDKLVIF